MSNSWRIRSRHSGSFTPQRSPGAVPISCTSVARICSHILRDRPMQPADARLLARWATASYRNNSKNAGPSRTNCSQSPSSTQTHGADARRQAHGHRRLSPKDTSKKYPTIFVRTPYNFNFWDVRNGAPRDMSSELDAVKRGYAFVEMNERGHFFSEGNYDILGPPLTDGDDAVHLDVEAALVERQGRHDRLLLHRGMATGRRGAGQSGVRGDDPAGLRRRCRARRLRTTSRATGIAAARCRCCSSPGSTASRIRCVRCFRRTRRRKI